MNFSQLKEKQIDEALIPWLSQNKDITIERSDETYDMIDYYVTNKVTGEKYVFEVKSREKSKDGECKLEKYDPQLVERDKIRCLMGETKLRNVGAKLGIINSDFTEIFIWDLDKLFEDGKLTDEFTQYNDGHDKQRGNSIRHCVNYQFFKIDGVKYKIKKI